MKPHDVLPYRKRQTYQDALQRQQGREDCQQEGPTLLALRMVSDGLDEGLSPAEICQREFVKCRETIRREAEFAALLIDTPVGVAKFLRNLADEMDPKS